jgi:hypothetical protein
MQYSSAIVAQKVIAMPQKASAIKNASTWPMAASRRTFALLAWPLPTEEGPLVKPHANYKPATDMQSDRKFYATHATADDPLDASELYIPDPSEYMIALVQEILETMKCDANCLCDLSSGADWGFFVTEVIDKFDPDCENRIAISVQDEGVLLDHLLTLLDTPFMTERVLKTFHWLFEARAITWLDALADHCVARLSQQPIRELFYKLCSFFPSPRHIDPILSLPAATFSDFLRHDDIRALLLTKRDLVLSKLRAEWGHHSDFAILGLLGLSGDELAELVAAAIAHLEGADTSDSQLICSVYRFLQPHALDHPQIIQCALRRLAGGVCSMEKGEIVQFLGHVVTAEHPAVIAAMIEAGVVAELCGVMGWQEPSLQKTAIALLMTLLEADPETVVAQ